MIKDTVWRRSLALLLICGIAALSAVATSAQTEGDYLYRVTLLRAAPGEFNPLLETIEGIAELARAAGDELPVVMRHSQGDHWDFMVIHPMGSHADYHAAARTDQRTDASATDAGRKVYGDLDRFTAYREDWFARSVDPGVLRERAVESGMYHIEMFAGLPGKRHELLEQRRMENRYYAHLNRQQNLIFVRDGGSNWDSMTIGFHRDLESFAAAGNLYSADEQDEAARVAGFSGVDDIGPYLRSLLSYHNDTIAVPAF